MPKRIKCCCKLTDCRKLHNDVTRTLLNPSIGMALIFLALDSVILFDYTPLNHIQHKHFRIRHFLSLATYFLQSILVTQPEAHQWMALLRFLNMELTLRLRAVYAQTVPLNI